MAERSFPRRGGPAAVDLVNTTIVERGRPHDLLASERDLAAWLAFERDRLDPETISTEISLADFHALREALRQTFTAAVRGRRPPAGALEAINRASLREPVAPQLDWSAARAPRLSAEAADPLAAVARSAIELLARPSRERLRACANPVCVLFFVADKRRRLYCSESCGNRVRVARHAARR